MSEEGENKKAKEEKAKPIKETTTKETTTDTVDLSEVVNKVVSEALAKKAAQDVKDAGLERGQDMPDAVEVRQYRKNGFLPTGHDGEMRYTGTAHFLTTQVNTSTGVKQTGLTEGDERYLEKALNLEKGTLNKYNKDFWGKFFIKIPRGGKTLKRSNPQDELEWRVMLVHNEFANSEAESAYTATATYVLSSQEDRAKETNKILNKKKEAFKIYSGMGIEEKVDFLRVYGKDPGTNYVPDFVDAEVGKVVDETPEQFLEIVGDTDYKMKLFVTNCVKAGIIKQQNNKYSMPGGDMIGFNLEETIRNLNDTEYQDTYLSLKSKWAAYNK